MAKSGTSREPSSLLGPDRVFTVVPPSTSLETDFPLEHASLLAERESWRKEIHRPATHTHKWWAQRLGSVFRAVLVSAVTSTRAEAEDALSRSSRLADLVVFDPFAGSGTTLAEAAKLGARTIGRDINPVATLVQRQALADWDLADLEAGFKQVEGACKKEISSFYRSKDGDAVLYYFWVATSTCPECGEGIDLFSNHVFAKHAYPRRFPLAHAVCPYCALIVDVDLAAGTDASCSQCQRRFDFAGPVRGQWMRCPRGHETRIVDALRGRPPELRMYAKLVVDEAGSKTYRAINDFDRRLFLRARNLWIESRSSLPRPMGVLDHGHNTRQALRWGFSAWENFFNERQLLCLGLLARAIQQVSCGSPEREALVALFSGTLEFNNLFCSYKGEGTGAVRHMFSHHVLKPERTPLEAHPWGTPLSSGAFSTLFERRLLRAHAYKRRPHDLTIHNGVVKRSFGLSESLGSEMVDDYASFESCRARTYLSTGDSAITDLPDQSVDLIVSDPPFMDNVHYSELADFFHAWLRTLQPFDGYQQHETTRCSTEVQSSSPAQFGRALQGVWAEAGRVLKGDGLLAFTFHNARIEGWVEVMRSLRAAEFVVTSLQPVKAEMSVATPKSGAHEPSNIDSIVVCRKRGRGKPFAESASHAAEMATERLQRLQAIGIKINATDVGSVLSGAMLSLLTADEARPDRDSLISHLPSAIDQACSALSLRA